MGDVTLSLQGPYVLLVILAGIFYHSMLGMDHTPVDRTPVDNKPLELIPLDLNRWYLVTGVIKPLTHKCHSVEGGGSKAGH